MKLALIGSTGRTGRHALDAALERGHEVSVLVRDPAKLPEAVRSRVTVVAGNATDEAALATLLADKDAVISALGPTEKEPDLHSRTATALIAVMREAGIRRFIGVSGAGIDVPGDVKGRRDKIISWLINKLGGDVVKDKPAEYRIWAASGLDWTLVRPPRLVDGAATGELEHDPHTSTRSTKIIRADLGAFLIEVAENDLYPGEAPFVANQGSR